MIERSTWTKNIILRYWTFLQMRCFFAITLQMSYHVVWILTSILDCCKSASEYLSILTEFITISEQDQRLRHINRKIRESIDTKLSEIQKKNMHSVLYCWNVAQCVTTTSLCHCLQLIAEINYTLSTLSALYHNLHSLLSSFQTLFISCVKLHYIFND